jgi:hypothetical protein
MCIVVSITFDVWMLVPLNANLKCLFKRGKGMLHVGFLSYNLEQDCSGHLNRNVEESLNKHCLGQRRRVNSPKAMSSFQLSSRLSLTFSLL